MRHSSLLLFFALFAVSVSAKPVINQITVDGPYLRIFGEIWGLVDSTAFSNIIAMVVAYLVYWQFQRVVGGNDSLLNDRKRLHWIYDALQKDDGELKRMVQYARAEKNGEPKNFRASLSSQIYNEAKKNN